MGSALTGSGAATGLAAEGLAERRIAGAGSARAPGAAAGAGASTAAGVIATGSGMVASGADRGMVMASPAGSASAKRPVDGGAIIMAIAEPPSTTAPTGASIIHVLNGLVRRDLLRA